MRYAALAEQVAPGIAAALKVAKEARKRGSGEAKGTLRRNDNHPLADALKLSLRPLKELLCDDEEWSVSSDGDDIIKLYWAKSPNEQGEDVVWASLKEASLISHVKPVCAVQRSLTHQLAGNC